MSGSAKRPRPIDTDAPLNRAEWFSLRRSHRREFLRLEHTLPILVRGFLATQEQVP